MSSYDAILKQYEDNTQKKNSGKKYDLKNYFSTWIPDGVREAQKRIRILPDPTGGSPFKELHGHKMQIDGQWKVLPCLQHNFDKDCPFCEARTLLLAEGDEGSKESAKKYSARKYYVVKIIDRDKESEGIKFWRFGHDYRGSGIFDKIIGVLKARQTDIAHPETGRDLIINIGRDHKGNPVVNSIMDADPTPLSDNADLAKEWLDDKRTWEDVYSVRTYDYMEIIVKGGTPAWSKKQEKWVDKVTVDREEKEQMDKDMSEDELDMSPDVDMDDDNDSSETVTTVETTEVTVENATDNTDDGDDEDDDLPF